MDALETGERPSGRQLSVAAVVAGLSPAAAAAGRVEWAWLVLWTGASVSVSWLLLRFFAGRHIPRGRGQAVLGALFGLWGVLLAARGLARTASRLSQTAGEASKGWLLLLLCGVLVYLGWCGDGAFFRLTEILWLAMAVTVAFTAVFGLARTEWRHVLPVGGGWLPAGAAAAEIFAPALFLLPYIYKERTPVRGQSAVWLAALGGVAAVLSLVTVGLLGCAAGELSQPFFTAGGLLARNARLEGLLSALWLAPDLTFAGLLCRGFGGGKRAAVSTLGAAALAFSGAAEKISLPLFAAGGAVLLVAALCLARRGEGE